ncbi:MAG: PHP domain-containing protein [Rhodocyclaceae bacterium]|jgi:predicted metal-dependent phosphoesterase TrpH|nr:PHP domain-containing protein [Rhodocyclaceae bacterium]
MNALNADLHCHSTASDGLLAPAALVARAAANGVDLLALTDHDELAGVAEAAAAARSAGIGFLGGVEVSVSWGDDQTVHIIGLGVDPAAPDLAGGLAKVRAGRDGRAARMASELERIGFHGALAGALRHAGNPRLVSRSHFARFLVEAGASRTVHEVFDHFLARGKPGYVSHQWASLAEAVGWIRAAGGLAVIAHPCRYRLSDAQREQLYGAFRDLGGEGLEVVSGAGFPDDVLAAARAARRFGFLASRASDFHGPEESPVDLGRAPHLPADLVPVWSRLI